MRGFVQALVVGVAAVLGGLATVSPPSWIAGHPVGFWLALGACLVVAALLQWQPLSRDAALKRRVARLLSKRRGLPLLSDAGRAYWGTAPARSELIGRTLDSDWLKAKLEGGVRAVGVFGPPGVGKTSLVVSVARDVKGRFENILWYSLQTAPPIDELLDRWLAALEITATSGRTGEKIDLLIAYTARHRCLCVLDAAELILEGAIGGLGPERRLAYEEILSRLVANSGRSTLVITSTARFAPFRATSRVAGLEVRELGGLDAQAVGELLDLRGVGVSSEEAEQVRAAYGGNPQAVLILAEYVSSAYAGRLARFLSVERDLFGFERFESLLDRQMSTLSNDEYLLVLLLAVWREPMAVETLHRVMGRHAGLGRDRSGAEMVASLRAKSIVLDTSNGVGLPSFLLELVREHLVRRVSAEIATERPDLLDRAPLAQAWWPDRVLVHQKRFVLQPIMHALEKRTGLSRDGVAAILRTRLRGLASAGEARYAAANLLFLLEAAGGEFVDLDLHGLTVRGADMRSAWLCRTDLSDAHLVDSIFAQPFGSLQAVALSQDDAATLLAAGSSLGRVLIWKRETGELIDQRQLHSEAVRCVLFSPDGETVYSAGEDGRLVAWDRGSGMIEVVDGAHGSWVWSMAPWEEERGLVTAGGDGVLALWRVKPLRRVGQASVPNAWIWVVLCADSRLVCAAEDGSVWSWAVEHNGTEWRLAGAERLELRLEHPVKAGVVGGEGEGGRGVVLGAADGGVYWVGLGDGRAERLGPKHRGAVRAVARIGGTGEVASAGDDGTIRVWDKGKAQLSRVLEGHAARIWSLAGHRSLPILASVSDDRSVRVWRADVAGHPDLSMLGVEVSVRSLDIDADGRVVAACSDDVVRRWSSGYDPEHVYVRRRVRFTAAVCVGRAYVAAADDGSIVAIAEGGRESSWAAHKGPVEAVRSHTARGLVASGGEDRCGRVWTLTGERIAELAYHRNRIWDISFSPSGSRIATGGGDQMVGVWDVDTGRLLAAIGGHRSLVLAVGWLTDEMIVSGGSDGTVRFWRVQGGGAESRVEAVAVANVGFVVRDLLCWREGRVIVGGRTRAIEGGGAVAVLDGSGSVLNRVDRVLPGAVRALAATADAECLYAGGDGDEIVEFAGASLRERRRLRIDGPYHQAVFAGTTGMSGEQRRAVARFGARLAR